MKLFAPQTLYRWSILKGYGVEFDAGINATQEVGTVQKDRIACDPILGKPFRFMGFIDFAVKFQVGELKKQ